jgi:hypothetical protein
MAAPRRATARFIAATQRPSSFEARALRTLAPQDDGSRYIRRGCRCAIAALAAALLWPAQPALADFVQQGSKLIGTGTIGDQAQVRQGTAVAVSADGNTLIVGGMPQNSSDGATWVFTRTGGVWTQQGAELIGTGGGNSQGRSVALSADGNTALVGGPGNGGNGGAWVFTRSGGVDPAGR